MDVAKNKGTDKYSHKSDSKLSNGILAGVGTLLVAATGGLSFFAGKSAITAMDNQAEQQIVSEIARLHKDEPEPTPEPTPVPEEEWTTEQLKWAKENHITWNEEGFPIDERGQVVDDPTTVVNEVEKWEALLEERNNPHPVEEPVATPEPTPEPTPVPLPDKPAWCRDNDMISIDEDGRLYYVTKDGDTLAWIARQTGFTVAELADFNGIDDANAELKPGTRIYFPLKGPAIDIESNVGLG